MAEKFTSEWEFSDVQFEVEGEAVYANKAVLGMCSDVFKAMFGGQFKEANMPKINLPDKKYQDFLNLMALLHPPYEELDVEQIDGLLPLVEEYQIEGLKHKIDDFMCKQAASVKSFVLSERYNLVKTRKYSREYFKREPLRELKSQDMYDQLDQTFIHQIMTERTHKYDITLKILKEAEVLLNSERPVAYKGRDLLCYKCYDSRYNRKSCSNCTTNYCDNLIEVLKDINSRMKI